MGCLINKAAELEREVLLKIEVGLTIVASYYLLTLLPAEDSV